MAKVFLSYAHKDAVTAGKIAITVRQAGASVWYDSNLRGGAHYFAEIAEHILQCDYFFFIVSADSVRSEWCLRELEYAANKCKKIVPVWIEDTRIPARVELAIQNTHYVFYHTLSDTAFAEAIRRVFVRGGSARPENAKARAADSAPSAERSDLERAQAAYSAGDFETAAEAFRAAAADGNGSAMYCIGALYMMGKGVEQDDKTAFAWFEKSAEAGYSKAQLKIALAYYNGDGVREDAHKAVHWMHKAAVAGEKAAVEWLLNEGIRCTYPPDAYQYGSDACGVYRAAGQFSAGTCSGQGEFQYISGSRKGEWRTGELRDGQLCGRGRRMYLHRPANVRVRDEGEFKDGQLHGQGKRFVLSGDDEGAYWAGSFVNGGVNGYSVYRGADGQESRGEWKDGALTSGTKEYKHHSGALVRDEGAFQNGHLHGQGKRFILSGGDKGAYWAGSFVNGGVNGYAVFRDADGHESRGEWKNGTLTSGVKEYIHSSGILVRDEGAFHNGHLHGQGKRFILSGGNEGAYWAGNFIKGGVNGYAVFRDADGHESRGQWKDGTLTSGTKEYIHHSDVLVRDEGAFQNGHLHGQGKRFILSGSNAGAYWASNFRNGAMNGHSVLFDAAGGRQEAVFVDGKRHGLTRVYNAKGKLLRESVYDHGRMVDPYKEITLYRKLRKESQ